MEHEVLPFGLGMGTSRKGDRSWSQIRDCWTTDAASAGSGVTERLELRVPLQALEAAAADRPDAAVRHPEHAAHLGVVRARLREQDAHQAAVALGQRVERAREAVPALGPQEAPRGAVVLGALS